MTNYRDEFDVKYSNFNKKWNSIMNHGQPKPILIDPKQAHEYETERKALRLKPGMTPPPHYSFFARTKEVEPQHIDYSENKPAPAPTLRYDEMNKIVQKPESKHSLNYADINKINHIKESDRTLDYSKMNNKKIPESDRTLDYSKMNNKKIPESNIKLDYSGREPVMKPDTPTPPSVPKREIPPSPVVSSQSLADLLNGKYTKPNMKKSLTPTTPEGVDEAVQDAIQNGPDGETFRWRGDKNHLRALMQKKILTYAKEHPEWKFGPKMADYASRNTLSPENELILAKTPHLFKPGWVKDPNKQHLLSPHDLANTQIQMMGDLDSGEMQDAYDNIKKNAPDLEKTFKDEAIRRALEGDFAAHNVVLRNNLHGGNKDLEQRMLQQNIHHAEQNGELHDPKMYAETLADHLNNSSGDIDSFAASRMLYNNPEAGKEFKKLISEGKVSKPVIDSLMTNPSTASTVPLEILKQNYTNPAVANAIKKVHPEAIQELNIDFNKRLQSGDKTALKAVNSKNKSDILKISRETFDALRANPKMDKFRKSLLTKTLSQHKIIHAVKEGPVSFTPNMDKLRRAREIINSEGGIAHGKVLQANGLDPAALGINHLKDAKGNIRADQIQQHIDSQPKLNYDVSTSVYKPQIQRHTFKQPSKVFQLNITPAIKQKLKDEGVYSEFKKIVGVSKRSAHPVGDDTLGWVRYTNGADGPMIDEIQSDFGQHLIKQISKNKQEGGKANIDEDALNKINHILFHGMHPSHLIHEAFSQALRDNGHVGERVHIWDKEPRAEMSGLGRAIHLKTVPEKEAQPIQFVQDKVNEGKPFKRPSISELEMMNNLLPALREGLVSDEDLNEFTKMENPEENYPYLRGKLANIIQNHITTVKEAKSFAPLIDKVIKAAPDDYHRKEAIHKIIEPLIEAGIHVDSALPENIRSEAKPVVKKLINEDLNGFKGGTEENQQRAERRAILLAPNMDLEEHNKWGAIYPNMKMNSPHSTDDEIASSHVSSPSHYPVLNPSVKHQETLAYLGRSNDTNPNSDAHRDNRSPDQLSQILHGGDGATVSGDHKQYITADEQGRAILPGGKFVAAKKEPLPVHVQEGYSDIPKKMDYKPSEYGEISTQNSSELKGKKTWAKTLLKSFKKRKNP